jgi:formylglycine-generating enzyme required for sulfatase activity
MLPLTIVLVMVAFSLDSCKGGKRSRKGKDSLAADSLGNKALLADSGKNAALKFENQENVLISVYIPGGGTELGSFNLEDSKFEDFNIMDIEANNMARQLDVESFFLDETEIGNIHYLEYLFHLQKDSSLEIYQNALPDTTVWYKEMAYNDPYVENYLRFPGFRFFPVVGVNWMQANDYCRWRTAKVNEWLSGIGGMDGLGKKKKKVKSPPMAHSNRPTERPPTDSNWVTKPKETMPPLSIEEQVIYRLPTEDEWEYAAQAFLGNQLSDAEQHKRIYPWDGNTVRNNSKKYQGNFLANFKRGRGDYGGILGTWHNDGAILTNYIWEYPPNDFGLYNMAGNVNEWVYDEYSPHSFTGEKEEKEEESGFLEGENNDYNKAGFSMFSNAKLRVYKGGSWNDVAFWLAPGARRFLAQDSSTATIGFRCAMTMAGSKKEGKKEETAATEE